MYSRSNPVAALCRLALCSLAITAGVFAQSDPPRADPLSPDRKVHRAADSPLDVRIKPERITVQDPPPLPAHVSLPLPPDHRIAVDPGEVPIDEAHWNQAIAALERGRAFLLRAQDDTGGWMIGAAARPTDDSQRPSPVAVAVTALVIKALVQQPAAADEHSALTAGLRFLRAARASDGSYGPGALNNYVTSSVVSALAGADEFANHEFMDEINAATHWLEQNQWDQGEGLDPRQDWFGGAGYGTHGRPDLSNTQMMLEAMYDAGRSPDEPAFQRALAFMSRAQNLRTTNAAEWAGDDGGFIYTPANGGESMASEYAGEGRSGENLPAGAPRSLRSYGSMTYAGFKSMLYAGLSPDDVRVRAAFDWIRRHWGFDENPGLGEQGLYYYYHTMSRALRIAQQNVITDGAGRVHNWREELIEAAASRQRDDGSWRNDADRWLEGEPVMATTYAVLALQESLKPVVAVPPAAVPAPAAPPAAVPATPVSAPTTLRFTIDYDPALAESYTGRVYVLCSPPGRREPRFGPQWFGTDPFLAIDVKNWKPDQPIRIDRTNAITYPAAMDDIPEAEYSVQAVVRLNPDSASIGSGAGNAYCAVWRGRFGGRSDQNVELHIDQVVEARPFAETDRVRLVEMKSDMLTAFHGRPITMRGAVLLPVDYKQDPTREYPVYYYIGGFGSDHRAIRYLKQRWDGTGFQDRIARVVLDPSCFGGHHVFADSANNGPRGTALVKEFIPELEKRFRFVAAPSARFVGGHSSGGWSSLWLQVAYPDVFGGVWSTAPDPIDFTRFQTIDIYAQDANAYTSATGENIPVARRGGQAFAFYRNFTAMETVYGEGGQLRSFEWVFSPPSGSKGPKPLYDRATGAIDPAVAEAWKPYDIRLVCERNWERLGPKLAGKLNVIVGDADTFYLDGAVVRFKEALERLGSDAVIEILPGHDHGSFLDRAMFERIDREMVESFDRAQGRDEGDRD